MFSRPFLGRKKNDSKSLLTTLLVLAVLGALLALAGCATPGQTPTSSADLPADAVDKITEVASVEEVETLLLESFPVQVQVLARGTLPDDCTTLGEADIERTDNVFTVSLSTVRPAVAECKEGKLSFEQTINLDAEGLPAGKYVVDVNGVKSNFTLDVDNALLPEPTAVADVAPAAEETAPEISGAAVAARTVMAKSVGADAAAIEIVSEEQMEWPDACLGLAKPEESCLQQITPGYKVVLSYEDATHIYRTDEGGEVVRIESMETEESATPPATESTSAQKDCTDLIAFVRDMTVPDGTKAPPNKDFTKTWRLKNAGTCTWDTSYDVVFVNGDQMSGPDETPLLGKVAPGKNMDVSVRLTSPGKKGTYKGNWALRNGNGEVFGMNKQGKDPFWLQIRVTEDATAAAQATGGSISGFVWHDLCTSSGAGASGCITAADGSSVGNGVYDEGEPRIGGMEVTLGRGTCPSVGTASVIADAQGNYSFTNLGTSVYCVSIDPESEYNKPILIPGVWTYPQGTNGQRNVKFTAGQAISDVNFGWDYQFSP